MHYTFRRLTLSSWLILPYATHSARLANEIKQINVEGADWLCKCSVMIGTYFNWATLAVMHTN